MEKMGWVPLGKDEERAVRVVGRQEACAGAMRVYLVWDGRPPTRSP